MHGEIVLEGHFGWVRKPEFGLRTKKQTFIIPEYQMNKPGSVNDMTLTPANTNYIPALDGFRGFAILMVVCYHYFAFSEWTRFGWIGVDFFLYYPGI